MKSHLRISVGALALLLVIWGCESARSDLLAPRSSALPAVDRVVISYDTAYFIADTARLYALTQSISLTARAYDADDAELSGVRFRWSRPAAVAAVTADTAIAMSGVASVDAIGDGRVKISVVAGGRRDSLWVRVSQVAKLLQATPASVLMSAGTTVQLNVVAEDSLNQPVPIRWRSTRPAFATVDDSGLLSAIATGRTVVRATAGALSALVPVEVRTHPLVGGIVMTPASDTVDAVGATTSFTAAVTDTAGAPMSGVTVTWTSSNTDVATIDASGVARSVAAGATRISAQVGAATTSGILRVRQVAASLSISGEPDMMIPGDTVIATCVVLDANSQQKPDAKCQWRSLNPAILGVNNDTTETIGHGLPTGLLEARAVGTTRVIAERIVDGTTLISDTVSVQVRAPLTPFANTMSVEYQNAEGFAFPAATSTKSLIIQVAGASSPLDADPSIASTIATSVITNAISIEYSDTNGIVLPTRRLSASVTRSPGPVLVASNTAYRHDAINDEPMESAPLADGAYVVPGETIWYRLSVTNEGEEPATATTATDSLPPELTYVAHMDDGLAGWAIGYGSANSTVTATLSGALAANSTRYFWVRATVK